MKVTQIILTLICIRIAMMQETFHTPITGNTPVYFDYIGQVWLSPFQWEVVTYIDVQDIYNQWVIVQGQMKTLEIQCEKHKELPWYKYTDCGPIAIYFKSKGEQIEKTIQSFEELSGLNLRNSRRSDREKRSVLGFVGEISKILFGTVTEEELNKYKLQINKMRKEQEEYLHIGKEQMTIIKGTLLTLNHTLREVTLNEEAIVKQFSEFGIKLRKEISLFEYETEATLQVNMIIRHIEIGLNECLHSFDMLLEAIVHAQNGVIQPQIITYAKIKKILEKADKQEYIIPPFSPAEASKIVESAILIQKGKLMYVTKIPLLNTPAMELYEIVPLPVIMSSNTTVKYIQSHSKYILSDKLKTKYAFITNEQFAACKSPNDITYVCKETMPISMYVPNVECLSTLLHPTTIELPDVCVNQIYFMSLLQTLWIPLRTSNEWIYICTKRDVFTALCPKDKVQFDIQGRGKIKLPQTCKGITKTGILYALTYKTFNNTNKDVVPRVEIPQDCCLDEVTERKLKEEAIDLPFPHILSNLDDLKIASYRIDEVQKLIDKEAIKLESSKWETYVYSTWSYVGTLVTLIIVWILMCCCCPCCRKCFFWSLRTVHPKTWWHDCMNHCHQISIVNNQYSGTRKRQNESFSLRENKQEMANRPAVKPAPVDESEWIEAVTLTRSKSVEPIEVRIPPQVSNPQPRRSFRGGERQAIIQKLMTK